VWHQRADRDEAHILVCFLAYVLWKTLEQCQRRARLGQSPRTIFGGLKRIQSTDVVLPAEDGRDVRLRCVVRPDAAQAALLGPPRYLSYLSASGCLRRSPRTPKCSGDFFAKCPKL
jgi:hypothetical protein